MYPRFESRLHWLHTLCTLNEPAKRMEKKMRPLVMHVLMNFFS